jgi:hypothetical protein
MSRGIQTEAWRVTSHYVFQGSQMPVSQSVAFNVFTLILAPSLTPFPHGAPG